MCDVDVVVSLGFGATVLLFGVSAKASKMPW
jgi:hypothetical protein